MNTETMFSSGKDDWETHDDLFKRYDDIYHFVLDAAANETNHKVDRWFGPGGEHEDALAVDWPLLEGHIWLNPPYSRGLQARFVHKAVDEMIRHDPATRGAIVCLLPACTDTKLFHEVIKLYGDVEFLKRRVRFKGAAQGAPFSSMIVVFA